MRISLGVLPGLGALLLMARQLSLITRSRLSTTRTSRVTLRARSQKVEWMNPHGAVLRGREGREGRGTHWNSSWPAERPCATAGRATR